MLGFLPKVFTHLSRSGEGFVKIKRLKKGLVKLIPPGWTLPHKTETRGCGNFERRANTRPILASTLLFVFYHLLV
jgi:hypothetical protein